MDYGKQPFRRDTPQWRLLPRKLPLGHSEGVPDGNA